MWKYTYSDELFHWGVKGMKWGVRRYQNADGTLTTRGKKRYSTHEDYDKAHSKKSVKQMSNQELRDRNNRLQMEKQYKDLTKKTGTGKKVVNTIIAAGTTVGGLMGAYATFKKFGKAVGSSNTANKVIDKIGDVVVKSIDFSKPFVD